jgi:hypothetical protein
MLQKKDLERRRCRIQAWGRNASDILRTVAAWKKRSWKICALLCSVITAQVWWSTGGAVVELVCEVLAGLRHGFTARSRGCVALHPRTDQDQSLQNSPSETAYK